MFDSSGLRRVSVRLCLKSPFLPEVCLISHNSDHFWIEKPGHFPCPLFEPKPGGFFHREASRSERGLGTRSVVEPRGDVNTSATILFQTLPPGRTSREFGASNLEFFGHLEEAQLGEAATAGWNQGNSRTFIDGFIKLTEIIELKKIELKIPQSLLKYSWKPLEFPWFSASEDKLRLPSCS